MKNHPARLNNSLHKYKSDTPTDSVLFTSCAEMKDNNTLYTAKETEDAWSSLSVFFTIKHKTKNGAKNNTLSLHMISRQVCHQFRNIDRDLFIQTLKSSGRLNSSGQKRGITSHRVQVERRLDHLECVHRFSTIPSMYPKSANQSDQRKKAVGVCGSQRVRCQLQELEVYFLNLTPF